MKPVEDENKCQRPPPDPSVGLQLHLLFIVLLRRELTQVAPTRPRKCSFSH